MAVVTFAERIALDLALLIADITIRELSKQRGDPTSEDTSKTTRVSQMAASRVTRRLGDSGSYDDTDATIGDQTFLEFGMRYAIVLYSSTYSFRFSDAARETEKELKLEIEEYRMTLTLEASTPVVKTRDNDDLNRRYTQDWDSDSLID